MIECRNCREVFRTPLEKLGARCPTCRLPLFDRSDRWRSDVADLGPCAFHQDNEARARCRRCGQRVCATCRTRWHDETLCPPCAGQALSTQEPGPREVARRDHLARWSMSLALGGWALLGLSVLPWLQIRRDGGFAQWAFHLFFLSLVPALIALGQAAWVLRSRGLGLRMAAGGLILGGLQIGLMLGILLINLRHN